METSTTAIAGGALTTPLWFHAEHGLQFIAVVMGIVWLAMQMYYKVKNERKRSK